MARPPQRPERDIIDLTEEPDSPVLQHAQHFSPPSRMVARSAAQSAARSAMQTASRTALRSSARAAESSSRSSQTQSPHVIDLTDVADDDPPSAAADAGAHRHLHAQHMSQQRQRFRQAQQQYRESGHGLLESLHLSMQDYANMPFAGEGSYNAGDGSNRSNGSNSNNSRNNDNNNSGGTGSLFGSFGSSLGGFSISGMAHFANIAFGGGGGGGVVAGNVSRSSRSGRQQGQSRTHARMHNRPVRAEAVRGIGVPDLHGIGMGMGIGMGISNERALFEEIMGTNPLFDLPDLNYQMNGGLFNTRGRGHGHGNSHSHRDVPYGGTRRTAYPAPTTAPEGYTRSTGEDMVAVCAGCDVELAYDPNEMGRHASEPPKKKTRSRKDREEHNFWAATACGHVFCKSCYENRRNCLKKDAGSPIATGGGGGSGATTKTGVPPVVFVAEGKTILCAVENCQSDVTAKKAWVGLFV
ncbi:uncharacterized protein SPSK_03359 [Sporothrix schenckii 1099-18]|uniref:Cell cycle control protein n=1 Tax=Sporothrix schenckii 1099-18 TaxID=1397361 RepID=A0A0F2LWN8_SPOSC|nr:uncharacterized protein SPSK_03359 [Sporothrix schenckii 1099-18]KJR81887.1 hypothetical protein SPSK_03359 [Sporothrix schenckii 1099-18]